MNEKQTTKTIKTLLRQRDEVRAAFDLLTARYAAQETTHKGEVANLMEVSATEITTLRRDLLNAATALNSSADINETLTLALTATKEQSVRLIVEKRELTEQVAALQAQDTRALQRRLAAKAEENRLLTIERDQLRNLLAELRREALRKPLVERAAEPT